MCTGHLYLYHIEIGIYIILAEALALLGPARACVLR